MAEVVLFHHVQGLTDGVRAFAEELRVGGHTVHTPDLFDGERPATIEEGVAHARSLGDEVLGERVDRAVADLPEGLVYAGFSFGAATAQRLAQTRPGARGALLYESCMPITGEWAFGPWPDGRAGADPRHGPGPVLRARGRHRRRPRAGRDGRARAGRAVRLLRATSTCSPTARCRRTTRTRRRWWCSGRESSSTGSGSSQAA